MSVAPTALGSLSMLTPRWVKIYSPRSASMGSTRDAVRAGR
jgi:hypothetical protein